MRVNYPSIDDPQWVVQHIHIKQGNQRWQTSPAAPPGGLGHSPTFWHQSRDTNPESLRPFVPEIWPNNVFNLSATYDLDLWPKILKIFVSHGVPIRNMYAKFHNDRLRNSWDITLWNFAKTRTNKHTNTHTNKQTHTQTDMGITIPRPPPMGGEVNIIVINDYYRIMAWKGKTLTLKCLLAPKLRLSTHMVMCPKVSIMYSDKNAGKNTIIAYRSHNVQY